MSTETKPHRSFPNIIERVKDDFSWHDVSEQDKISMECIRSKLMEAALLIAELTPQGREQSTAITHLEQAMFWSNAGVARGPRL